ncbi:MAG: trimethylamine methyltransferase family protein [Gammaproteobacteria bacterium]|nr:trimethylamine methyltransferase family protein [Gammaproteobacteria bacterium]
MSAVTKPSRRIGGRAARVAQREADSKMAHIDMPAEGYSGGQYKPLSDHDVSRIHTSALHILETVGMGMMGDITEGAKKILEMGGELSDQRRILFPRALIEDMLATTTKSWTLHGLDPDNNIEISHKGAHYGTAGGAVEILDFETGIYREPTLDDLYDSARLIDTLPNIHWCYRPLIARDMPDVDALDINTAYALLSGTTKPWGITLGSAENVKKAISMFDMVLGGEGRFKSQPSCHMVQGAGVPPLRFANDRCIIKEEAIRQGMPIMIASAPQAGATSPAALAGTIVQVVAEVLAGLTYANAIAPGHPCNFAAWPFVSDLRTGAMSGGSGEQALLAAAVAQMSDFYGLPSSVPAGMADSKLPDAQSGAEKAYTTALAGLAGANMVHESAGMHASLLGFALESLVIDNDMLGNVQRLIRGIEVTDETLSTHVIEDVILKGPGHYLGHDQTLGLMESEYHYPALADRATPREWQENGAKDIVARAKTQVRATLSSHYPSHIDPKLDAEIRARFDIRLPESHMTSTGGRW